MQDATKILTEHPYATLFLAVLAEQIGLPFPAVLFLTGAGALAQMGHARLGLLLLTGASATLLADLLWYGFGRLRGGAVVKLVQWLSPSPDGYARRAWRAFRSHGERVLVWAKFVPSLSTFTTPLAGAARMPLSRFLAYNGAGTLLWNGAFLGAGFALGPEIGRVAHASLRVGTAPLLVVAAILTAAIAWKWLRSRGSEPVLAQMTGEHRPVGR
jgi:membrane protein DedA with SNARE-associated domain